MTPASQYCPKDSKNHNSINQLANRVSSKLEEGDYRDASWSQATLPVNSGGLGFWSASNLAPSTFLASDDGVTDLTRQLLPTHLSASSHGDTDLDLSTRKDAFPVDTRLVNILNVRLAILKLYPNCSR